MAEKLTLEDDVEIERMRNSLIEAMGYKFDWALGCIASAAFVANLLTYGVMDRELGDIETLKARWIEMLNKLIDQRMAERRQ